MTQASIMQNVRDPLGLNWNQKYLNSGQKWPTHGQFTRGRLRDSSEYHAECKGSISTSLEPKRSKIRHEMAELCPIYQRKVG